MPHTLTDEQWELVGPMVLRKEARTARPSADRRLMPDGVLWVLCTVAPWRDLPERFGPHQTVYDYLLGGGGTGWSRGPSTTAC